MESDKRVLEEVVDALEFDPKVRADGIGVAVKGGVVTLSGYVPSYAERVSAIAATQRIRGVKAVAQDIVVRLPSDQKVNDDEIADRAVSVLKWSIGVPDAIKVTVDDGWVTLNGEVPWHYLRQEAEAAIRRLNGVVSVVNNVTVKARVQPADVREKIAKAFRRNAELESSGINVDIDSSVVTLTGNVKARYERDIAEEAAWSIPGVTEVRDMLAILPPGDDHA